MTSKTSTPDDEEEDPLQEGRLYYESLFADNIMCVTYKGTRVFKNPERMEIYYKRKMTSEEIERNRDLRRELKDKCLYGNHRLDENIDNHVDIRKKVAENEEHDESEEGEGDGEDSAVVTIADASDSSSIVDNVEIASVFKLEKLVVTEPSFHSIREATMEDYEEMKILDRDIFEGSKVWDSNLLLGVIKSLSTRVLLLIISSENTSTYSSGEENCIAGFIAFDKTGKIMKLGVAPRNRCRGYGCKLLDEALFILKHEYQGKCLSPILHVHPENDKAIKLYRKKGFTVDACVKDYYKLGEDALRMIMYYEVQEGSEI